jgi:2-haloacid dehalogenase
VAFDFQPFKILTFDCYGTLIDWETGILQVVRPWLKGASNDDILGAFASAEAIEEARTPSKLYPGILEAAYLRMTAALDAPPSSENAKEFGASAGAWPAFTDTADALARLHKRFKLGILSNVDRDSFAKTNVKLGVTFDLLVTAADVGSYKPNPKNFQTLLAEVAKLGIAPHEVLHVAQSLFHDHKPAQAMGLKTCWIDRRMGRGGGATMEARGVTPDVAFMSLAALADAAGV